MDDSLLTPDQVAARVQVSRRTVDRAIERGELEASELASRGCWRIRPAAVDDWLALRSNRRRAPSAIKPLGRPGPGAAPKDRGGTPRSISGMITPEMGRDRAA